MAIPLITFYVSSITTKAVQSPFDDPELISDH